MTIQHYRDARHDGRKTYQQAVSEGGNPYLPVLDELLQFIPIAKQEYLGIQDIPISHIVGTKTRGRSNAFAADFMPLLEDTTEFAKKWALLADSHLEEGIRDPLIVYEYLNQYYVLEGNKRVSVLKYFDAIFVSAKITRVLPEKSDDPINRTYYAYLDFNRKTGVNYIWFSQPSRFHSLMEVTWKDEEWTDEKRAAFSSAYYRFRKVFKKLGGDQLMGTTADAFLAYLRLYDFDTMRKKSEKEIREELHKSWSEIGVWLIPEPIALELEPQETERNLISRLVNRSQDVLKVLFIHEKAPEVSAWSHIHDEGRKYAESVLGNKVETSFIVTKNIEEEIKEAVEAGVKVIFTTSPKFLKATTKAALKYPSVKFLNCSVYAPHPSVRSYYGRMYEVKFLAGLMAGALSNTHKIGYLADYPIHGSTAALNAFAIGARMSDPYAKVYVKWKTSDEKPWEELVKEGVDMICGYDSWSPIDLWRAHGLYRIDNGIGSKIAYWNYNWGHFYVHILQSIIDGKYRMPSSNEVTKAINYWWGLSSGIMEIHYSEEIPEDTLRLTQFFQQSIMNRTFHPFDEKNHTAENILKMNELEKNVIGKIPSKDELSEEARELIRIQGVRSEDKEEDV